MSKDKHYAYTQFVNLHIQFKSWTNIFSETNFIEAPKIHEICSSWKSCHTVYTCGYKVCVSGYPSEIMILVDFADCEIIIDGMHKCSHIALESDDWACRDDLCLLLFVTIAWSRSVLLACLISVSSSFLWRLQYT